MKGYESPHTQILNWNREVTVLCTSDMLESYEKTEFEFDD